MKNNRKKTGHKKLLIVVGAALTVIGFIMIPSRIDKYGNKLYKASLKTEEIDFDNMGPEIVKKETIDSQNKGV